MTRPHIGYFTAIDGWGGSESYLRDMALECTERGNPVIVFGVGGSRLMRELRERGVPFVSWRQGSGSAERRTPPEEGCVRPGKGGRCRRLVLGLVPSWLKLGAGSLREVRRLEHVFREHPVDVLHINAHGYELAGLAARRVGIASLMMQHIMPADEPYWFRRYLIRMAARGCDRVVCVSRACVDAWQRETGVTSSRLVCIYHGIDAGAVRMCSPTVRREAADPLRVVSVGRLHPMKGFKHLVQAVCEASDSRLTVDIFGEGDLRNELARQIASLGLESHVRLCGHVEDMPMRLSDYHAFALMSVSHEAFGLALAEAMAAGLPAVTSDFGPLPELNKHGECGWVVPTGDATATARALCALADDPESCVRMGQAARDRAVSLFAKERMVNETLALYEELASSSPARK